MNKYNGLLSSVAHKYHICKGARETENEWKTRLVYSICGMMAYASLWDDSEEDPISIRVGHIGILRVDGIFVVLLIATPLDIGILSPEATREAVTIETILVEALIDSSHGHTSIGSTGECLLDGRRR